ncbi:MAG: hypothetical protein IKZ98_02300 [Clostridia bacterium]|nr:hypothetical protein [Clostridia bacterium]
MLLLKAKERNWGLVGPGDWEKRSWKINDDGWYQYTTTFRSGSPDIPEIPAVTEEGQLSVGKLQELKALLAMEWTDETTQACDGSAWEFKMYENDTVIKHRELNYVYGIEPYESIAVLLSDEVDE